MKRGKEDYLRVIYELEEKEGVRSINIAEELKISKASVSEMLRKLACKKLIKLKPYSKIFLTTKGKKEAEKIYDKHHLIKNFMKKFFRYEDEKARKEAHELEHAFSEKTIEILKESLYGQTTEIKVLPNYIG